MLKRRRLVTVALLLTATGALLLLRLEVSFQNDFNVQQHFTSTLSPSSDWSSSHSKQVTKSLEEIKRDLPPIPELSDHVLFFNRVPKTGSEMMVLLLQWLQGANGFRHIRLRGGNVRMLDRVQQEELVQEVTKFIRDEAVPITFDRHAYFVNFTEFDRQSPTHINLVRDPVEKALSRFYYRRVTPDPANPDLAFAPPRQQENQDTFDLCVQRGEHECHYEDGHSYDLSVPYFCGQHDFCTLLNNKMALERAKANVDRYYPVVGVLEELNTTLLVFEKTLPYFFKGVQQLYYHELLEPHKNRNKKKPQNLEPNIRKQLQDSLRLEYDFYYWVKRRLLQQYSALTKT